MTHWFTADLHLGHKNIIEYCSRPYDTVDEMNTDLIRRWNDAVDEDDTVIVVGDFAMGKLDETLLLTPKLNGSKHLLPGNHDRMFNQSGQKYATEVLRYLVHGFDRVLTDGYTNDGYYTVWNGIEVELCHFPYVGDSKDGIEDRYQEFRPTDLGRYLVHGHVHDKWLKNGSMINVGVDAWDGYPVPFDTVKELFEHGSTNIDPLRWEAL